MSSILNNPSGKDISNLQELLIKSPIDYKLRRADLFTKLIIPLLIQNNYSFKKIFEYIFICLKNEGNLNKFSTPEEFFSYISVEENLYKFMTFLMKNEYVVNEKNNSIKTLLENYIAYHNEKTQLLSKLDALKVIDIILKENEFLIHEDSLNNGLKSAFITLYKYLSNEIIAEEKNTDSLYKFQKKI